ncbi:MAG: bifunctional methionine sulfoxide reductase B/A protein [Gammaproteobacteria bacterium]
MSKSFKSATLTPTQLNIIRDKGTEHPFTGEYDNFDEAGTYLCRQCGLALFRAQSKFHSGCGWPSFEQEIDGAVAQRPDPDGRRIEITCARCQGHLGHVFHGEQFTFKNTRHCVNSNSLDFVNDLTAVDTEEAIFAGGCFWGVEYYFKKLSGVLKVEVGYSGGHELNPTYETICSGSSGHFEVVRVLYDPHRLSYEEVAKYFFEIHDPTQINGQGPDLGEQYLSVVFYFDDYQRNVARQLITLLNQKGYEIATVLRPVNIFWPAEGYHQNYYQKTGKQPYCHHYVKRFE